jgi:hypothetical protein
VKYTDNLAEGEMTLQGTIYRRNEVGNNCGKIKVMRIQGSQSQFRSVKNKIENVEYFNCLGIMTTSCARCTRKIKFSYAMARAALNKNMTLFTSKLDLYLRKHLETCHSWNFGK